MRFVLFLLVLAVPVLYSGSSAASLREPARHLASDFHATPDLEAAGGAGAGDAVGTGAAGWEGFGASLPASPLRAMFQSAPEDIQAFDSTCTTPQTVFAVGETVCAKVSGTLLGPRVVYWISPVEGGIVQTDIVSTTSLTATRTVNARGQWRLYLAAGDDGTLRKAGFFSVSDAARPSVDLSVDNTIDRRISSFAAGHTIRYLITVANNGPDAAEGVVLTEQAPNDSTFSSSSQDSGPLFNCQRPGSTTTCTIASLAAGDVAEFNFVYTVDGGTPDGTEISNTFTVASETEELHQGDNSSTASVAITGEVTATECVLECPNDITVTADTTVNEQRGAVVTFGAAEPFGECGALTASQASATFFPVGSTTVTVSSEQGGGGCSFTVTVIDAPAPAITCPPDKNAVADTGELEASVEVGTPTTSGTVSSVIGVRSDGLTRLLTDPYPVGTTTITWTARDAAPDADGLFPPTTRSASCQQRVIVTSNDAPTITCAADNSFDAPAGQCEMTLTAAQIGTPTTTGNGVEVVGVRSDRLPLTDPYPGGETVITWTATDSVGRVVSCTQTITVRGASGNAPPVLEVPPDVEVLTDSCSALVDDELGVATATGACGHSVKIARTGIPTRIIFGRTVPTFIFPVGTTVITYTATDSAGNSTTGTQRVVVKERSAIPPTVTAPPDLVVNTGAGAASCGITVGDATLGTATANDNCPGVSVVRSGVPAGNLFPVGETIVTYTATDASGNTATDTQKVTVIDDTPPTFNLPDLSANLPLNSPDTTLVFTFPATTTDNCGNVAVNYSTASGTAFPVGTTVVTATATDAAGNTATDTFTVTVLYNFAGFFSPVNNPPVFNQVKAGQGVPVKFSLSGNKGLGIMFADFPMSQPMACDSGAMIDPIEETVTAGGSTLSYDAETDRYVYTWKTEKSWTNTCRQLTVKLADGTEYRAYFSFTK
jgi:uncharacterized repeat protein (TIGR01451 family)